LGTWEICNQKIATDQRESAWKLILFKALTKSLHSQMAAKMHRFPDVQRWRPPTASFNFSWSWRCLTFQKIKWMCHKPDIQS